MGREAIQGRRNTQPRKETARAHSRELAGVLPPKVCDNKNSNNKNSILDKRDAGKTSASTGASEIPADLERLVSCGVCFGRLLSKELNRSKQLEEREVLDTASLPRWDHRSAYYQEHYLDTIFGLTDRGVCLDGWCPFEEHGERPRIE